MSLNEWSCWCLNVSLICQKDNLLADLHVKINSIFDYFPLWLQKGVYGDVQRVKILYNKKDSALIQMADGNQSQLGKIKLCVIYTASVWFQMYIM